MKIAIRGGHNFTVVGANGKVSEVVEDRKILASAIKFLKQLGHEVLDVTPDRTSTSAEDLVYGVSRANAFNADYGCSIHLNAFDGNARGTEVINYPGSANGKAIGTRICAKISALGFPNRGAKDDVRGLYEPKNTKMEWNIIECFFCDSQADVDLYNRLGVDAIGKAIAEGITGQTIVEAPPAPSTPTVMYRVILDGKQVEALSVQANAETAVKAAVDSGKAKEGKVQRNTDSVDLFFYPPKVTTPAPTPIPTPTPDPTRSHPIMGNTEVTAEQMAHYVLRKNPTPKLFCPILELANIYLEEGKAEGVRGDVAFAQAIKETGFFAFGGDVIPDQNNYCGLGTTGGGVKGAYFNSPREGARAQIQHLKAYASKDPLKQTCVDPRYSLVTKGVAPNWEDLNGRWAVPGTNYGQEILEIHQKIRQEVVTSLPVEQPQPTPTPIPEPPKPDPIPVTPPVIEPQPTPVEPKPDPQPEIPKSEPTEQETKAQRGFLAAIWEGIKEMLSFLFK